jgi:hypothetical protein
MSKVVKYYYSRPIVEGTICVNHFNDKVVVFNPRNRRRYTIAAIYDDDAKTIKFGLAICQPVDNFCKATGRAIAEKNAQEKPFHVIEGFNGRRNDYADEVMTIMIRKEQKLLKKDNPNLFNPKNFIE